MTLGFGIGRHDTSDNLFPNVNLVLIHVNLVLDGETIILYTNFTLISIKLALCKPLSLKGLSNEKTEDTSRF